MILSRIGGLAGNGYRKSTASEGNSAMAGGTPILCVARSPGLPR